MTDQPEKVDMKELAKEAGKKPPECDGCFYYRFYDMGNTKQRHWCTNPQYMETGVDVLTIGNDDIRPSEYKVMCEGCWHVLSNETDDDDHCTLKRKFAITGP